MKTKVIFRKRPSGQIIALFPEVPYDVYGKYCSTFEDNNRHSGADAKNVIAQTEPATLEEAAKIVDKLASFGYELEIITRTPVNAAEARKEYALTPVLL